MNGSFKKIKNALFNLPPWGQKSLLLVTIAVIANHIWQEDSFPFGDTYTFPWHAILISLVLGGVILFIVELNLAYFEKKYFKHTVNTRTLLLFLLSSLGIITAIYVPFFYIVSWYENQDFDLYFLFIGLFITLLISALAIIFFNAKRIYKLHKLAILEEKLVIQKDNKNTVVNVSDIAFFYSMDKMLYAVQNNGQALATDFTLNEIESKINSHLFIRANRQCLVHFSAVKETKAIENGKLLVTIIPPIFTKEPMQIVVSRYKKREFNNWFRNKQIS